MKKLDNFFSLIRIMRQMPQLSGRFERSEI